MFKSLALVVLGTEALLFFGCGWKTTRLRPKFDLAAGYCMVEYVTFLGSTLIACPLFLTPTVAVVVLLAYFCF